MTFHFNFFTLKMCWDFYINVLKIIFNIIKFKYVLFKNIYQLLCFIGSILCKKVFDINILWIYQELWWVFSFIYQEGTKRNSDKIVFEYEISIIFQNSFSFYSTNAIFLKCHIINSLHFTVMFSVIINKRKFIFKSTLKDNEMGKLFKQFTLFKILMFPHYWNLAKNI